MKLRSRCGGMSWIEFSVSAAALAVLAAVFVAALSYYQEYAEKTAMELTVMNMRSGLRFHVAELIVQDRMGEIAGLAGRNPVAWLAAKPGNYAGEFAEAQAGSVAPGSWYFDATRRQLVYKPDSSRHFVPGPDGEKAVRYAVVALPAPAGAALPAQGAALKLVNDYRWF